MKTKRWSGRLAAVLAIILLMFASLTASAQDDKPRKSILDQNISIVAEEESLSNVIQRICEYFNLDYSYNSKLVEGKKVSLNISNVPIRYVLEKLMKDYYLIFEIEDNILVVRDYVPLKESLDYERKIRYTPGKNRFEFINKKDKSLTIDFKTASNLIIIPVIINDSDTLNFILDTGVRIPIITELPFVDKLSLNYMQPVSISGLGEGESMTAYRSGNNTMKIGSGLVSYNQEVHMVIDDDFQISQILGLPVHGLIGFDLFKDFVVEIDYDNHKLTLIKPKYYRDRVINRDIVMPIHFEHNKPYVRTTIVTDKNEYVPVKLLVDTGASDAIWLSTKSDNRIGLPVNNIEAFLGRGLNGDLYGKKGRIGGIWVGPLILDEPIVSFPEAELVDQIITDDRNGTLGAEILRRFYVTIDYPGSQIKLRPTSKVNEDFNYNMSGLEISNPFPGMPIFQIDMVRAGSPGERAGLKENDQILSVNRSHHKSLSLNDINLILMSKEDRKINMTVLREGQEIETTFYLEKVF
ncbi:aspartyl protease family protein [Mangrovibacterium lignilyticum]|uniref:aspartyl protease family protein n=1 Tax=Mangrovibacterium lignilyticum TaxID=2668052 RepID=UPI0013D3F6BF|nr:aspartyl protease family protein [Mangrovibacterium lignilyticum]